MNNDPVEEASTYEARAERARQGLADNLRDITSVGGKMLRKTGRIGAFALLGMGVLGLAFLIGSRVRRRRALKNPLRRYLAKEPSFIGQALRSVALSVLSVLATRFARQLPLPLPRGEQPAE